jgi:SAM-dependent methyltransferase
MDDSLRELARAARAEIASSALRGAALEARLRSVPPHDRDAWTNELLGLDDAPADDADLPRGSVPYLPCGVDAILAMVREVPLGAGDAFVDLGSGLGRVVMLAHLLSGARGSGLEIQEALVAGARARSEALALPAVSFLHADAAQADLEGSVFFLYAPFNGPMLAAVLARLEALARRRAIVVCTVDLELHALSWLERRRANSSSPLLAIYDSRVVRP